MNSVPRIFCLGERVGFVHNKNFYALVSFNKRKFKCLLIELIKTKQFYSADMLLKVALQRYMGIEEFCKRYQNKGNTDSVFYTKWRNLIKNHKGFKLNAQTLIKNRQEWRDKVSEGRLKYSNAKMAETERYIGIAKARRTVIKQI